MWQLGLCVYVCKKHVFSAENLLIYKGKLRGRGRYSAAGKGKRESECSLGTALCKEKLLRKSEEQSPKQPKVSHPMLNAVVKDELLLTFDSWHESDNCLEKTQK